MSITNTTRKAGPFTGNGLTTVFPFSFKVFAAADLLVVSTDLSGNETTLVLGSAYSVVVNANQDANPGGTVVMSTAPASGFLVTLASALPQLQPVVLTNMGGFYPSIINDALDRLTIFCQQILEKVSRSLVLPISAAGVSNQLPFPVANMFLGWNAQATALQNIDSSALASIVAFGTAKADIFSGNASTTTFTLSANPGAQNNLDVSIAGISQKPGLDFTWSGGLTITFATAPPAGTNNILCRYLQALPQGASDSSTAVFLQAGTGAVSRFAQDKLRETVSIEDFGGVPGTDCIVAMVKALATGEDVYLPDGDWYHSASIALASAVGQALYGSPRARLIKLGAFDQIVISGSYNRVEGITLYGNGLNGSGIGITGGKNFVYAVAVYGQGVSGQAAHGIYLDGSISGVCSDNRIEACLVYSCWGIGYSSSNAPDNTRLGNVAYLTGLEGFTDDNSSYRTILVGNKADSCCQTGGVGGFGFDNSSGALVSGNFANNTRSNLPGFTLQNNVGPSIYSSFTGNVATDNTGGGIWLKNGAGGTSNNNTVTGFTFQNNTGFDIKIDAGCTGNSLSGNGTNAVIVDANAGGVNPKSGIVCSARAYLSGNVTAATGDGTVVTLPLNAVNFNNGNCFNVSTYTFTAKVTGLYQACAGARLQSGSGATYAQLQIVQAGSATQVAQGELDLTAAWASFNLTVSDLFALQAGDTLVVKVMASGGTKNYTINGAGSTTFFSVVLGG